LRKGHAPHIARVQSTVMNKGCLWAGVNRMAFYRHVLGTGLCPRILILA
jgi:hypothetical protein